MESEAPEIPDEYARKRITLKDVVWFVGFVVLVGGFVMTVRDHLSDSRREDVQLITKSVDASIDAHTNALRNEISVQVASLRHDLDATNARIDLIQTDRADKLATFTDRDNKQDQQIDGLNQLTHQQATELVRINGRYDLLSERYAQLRPLPNN